MRISLGCLIALLVAVIIIVLVRPEREMPPPPILNIVGVEPAGGILDETGTDVWLATICVSNSDTRPRLPENCLYVKEVKAKTVDGWTGVDSSTPHLLPPGGKSESMLPVSARFEYCQVSYQYTGNSLSFSGRPIKGPLLCLAERLPLSVRSRLPRQLWRWLGFNKYKPSSRWQEMKVELPIPTASASQGEIHSPENKTGH